MGGFSSILNSNANVAAAGSTDGFSASVKYLPQRGEKTAFVATFGPEVFQEVNNEKMHNDKKIVYTAQHRLA